MFSNTALSSLKLKTTKEKKRCCAQISDDRINIVRVNKGKENDQRMNVKCSNWEPNGILSTYVANHRIHIPYII